MGLGWPGKGPKRRRTQGSEVNLVGNGCFSPEMKLEDSENDEWITYLCKLRHDSVEEIETNLVVVTVSVEDTGDGRKRSPKVRWKSSSETRCRTSTLDLGGYERRLGKPIVLLESSLEGYAGICIHT